MSAAVVDVRRSGWRATFAVHWAAEVFPPLPAPELRALGEDSLVTRKQAAAMLNVTETNVEHARRVVTLSGDYARVAAAETFTASYNDRHTTELARLHGARAVFGSETERNRAWAEARIKQITGGDTITARFMRQDDFEYVPQFKLTMIGNYKPLLRGVGDAIARRLLLLPFERKPEHVDDQLEEKLMAEAPGILAWMIEGCLDWQATGLLVPETVKSAVKEYLRDQDTLGGFIEERCVTGSAFVITTKELWEDWIIYAREQGTSPGTRSGSFADDMRRLGFDAFKFKYGIRGAGFRGLRLRTPDDDDEL